MKREKANENIPLHSHEATIIVGKLLENAVKLFRKNNISMPLNEKPNDIVLRK